MSLGAVQKVIDRVSQAILPHYEAIATLARQAPVGYIDETPWYCQNALQWLWTLTTETVSLYLIHPHRSKEAFFALIEDWQGILVSDGYGVYQTGSITAKPVWPISSAPPAGCRKNATRNWPPVARGRSRSCSAYATWPKRPPPGASGARGMRGFAT